MKTQILKFISVLRLKQVFAERIKPRFAIIFLGFVFLSFLGCDSPRNNRVIASAEFIQNSYSPMSLNKVGYSIVAIWTQGPYPEVFENSKLMVLIFDSEWVLTDLEENQSLSFSALMPSMGHGPEDAGYFQRKSVGIYENPSVVFQMGGDWQMELSVLDSNYQELDKIVWLEFL